MDAAVVQSAAPFGRVRALEIGFAALNDRHQPFPCAASQLAGDPGELAVQQRDDRARGVGRQRFPLIAEQHMHAIELLNALVAGRFPLDPGVQGRQLFVGPKIEGLLPIVERVGNPVASVCGQTSQQQNVRILALRLCNWLQYFERLSGLVRIQQLNGLGERWIARLGRERLAQIDGIHRGRTGPLVLEPIETREGRFGNVPQNRFAVHQSGDLVAVRPVSQREPDLHRRARGQAGGYRIVRLAPA